MEEIQDGYEGSKALKSQISIRCAKVAIMLSCLKSSLDRQLDSSFKCNEEHEVMRLKREMADLKVEFVREKAKFNRIRILSLMEFLLLQMAFLMSLSALGFVFFAFY